MSIDLVRLCVDNKIRSDLGNASAANDNNGVRRGTGSLRRDDNDVLYYRSVVNDLRLSGVGV